MELQVGVKVLLRNKEGKYLLIHRSSIKYPKAAGRWDGVGGRIKPGTTLMESLKREVREETDLELIDGPKLIAAQDILRVPGKHIVRLTYTATVTGEPELDTEENDQYQWVTGEQFKSIEDMDKYLKELLDSNLF